MREERRSCDLQRVVCSLSKLAELEDVDLVFLATSCAARAHTLSALDTFLRQTG